MSGVRDPEQIQVFHAKDPLMLSKSLGTYLDAEKGSFDQRFNAVVLQIFKQKKSAPVR